MQRTKNQCPFSKNGPRACASLQSRQAVLLLSPRSNFRINSSTPRWSTTPPPGYTCMCTHVYTHTPHYAQSDVPRRLLQCLKETKYEMKVKSYTLTYRRQRGVFTSRVPPHKDTSVHAHRHIGREMYSHTCSHTGRDTHRGTGTHPLTHRDRDTQKHTHAHIGRALPLHKVALDGGGKPSPSCFMGHTALL